MLSRVYLERITAGLVVTLTSVLAFGTILMIANGIFAWDIFPPFTEKIVYFIGASALVVIMAGTLINIMLNVSRLADYAGSILERKRKQEATITTSRSFEDAYEVGFSPKLIVITILIITLLVTGILFVALWAHTSRQDSVISTYTNETQTFLSSLGGSVDDLYQRVFDTCDQLLVAEQQKQSLSNQPNYGSAITIPCQAAQEHLSSMGVEQLKDSSAIAYVKVVDGSYSLLTASGDFTKSDLSKNRYSSTLFSYNDTIRSDLMQYFETGKEIVLWQDFIPYIPGKEVVVPVKSQNMIKGYIFRGVIER